MTDEEYHRWHDIGYRMAWIDDPSPPVRAELRCGEVVDGKTCGKTLHANVLATSEGLLLVGTTARSAESNAARRQRIADHRRRTGQRLGREPREAVSSLLDHDDRRTQWGFRCIDGHSNLILKPWMMDALTKLPRDRKSLIVADIFVQTGFHP